MRVKSNSTIIVNNSVHALITPRLSAPVGTAQLTGENVNFSKIFQGKTKEQDFHRGDNKTHQGWYENPTKWSDKIYYAVLKTIPDLPLNTEMD